MALQGRSCEVSLTSWRFRLQEKLGFETLVVRASSVRL